MDLLTQKKEELKAIKRRLSENELQMNAARHEDSDLQIKREIKRLQENAASLLAKADRLMAQLSSRDEDSISLLDATKQKRKYLLARQEQIAAEIKTLESKKKFDRLLKDIEREIARDPNSKLAESLLEQIASLKNCK